MRFWKTAALASALAGAAGAGAALGPVGHAQQARTRTVAPTIVQAFGFGSARIGVTVTDIDDADVKGKPSAGVLVDSVEEGSPAEKAGLKKGDIVTEFDGERVRSVRQFTRLVTETPPGRTVSAAVQRDGQRVTVSLTPRESNAFRFDTGDLRLRGLAELETWGVLAPPAPPAPPHAPGTPPAARAPRAPRPPVIPDIETFIWRGGNQLGVSVQSLSDQLGDYFGVKEGVLVTAVDEGSTAAKAGVKAGDVITSVNGTNVADPSALRRALQRLDDGAEMTLGVSRDKKSLTLKGKMETPSARRRTSRTIL